MGEVYAAEHVHIDKRFAIKLLKPEIVSNEEAVKRFYQEARSSSSIGHRNIIAIDDFNQLADGRIYMCMELLNGAALNDMLLQPMPVDRMLNILIQTGHGLAAAHAKNIIHRDMKPENIFVTIGPQGEDIPKILDFGIAKVSGNDGQNHLTRTGTIFGTPFYMAPEQALGNPVDARTDIYAMGVIMYECFAGSLPFQGESFMGILTQHITSEPEPVASRAAKAGRTLPNGLGEIITRCMQKDPNQRYRTMDELVNALIAVYRGIAGPGMSTYMEAFPAGSAQHVMQPTPQPMQPAIGAPVRTNADDRGERAECAAPERDSAWHVGAQSSPGIPMQSGPSALYDPGTGVGRHAVGKKSKTGLIIALVVVVAAGAGIAAVVVLGGGDGKQQGAGSGSQVATTDHGSDHVVTPPPPDHGSDHVAVGSDHAGSAGSADVGSAGTTVGSDATSNHVGSAVPPGPTPIHVVITTEPDLTDFEILDNNVKIPDALEFVPVIPGTTRNLVIRAKGFKDKAIVLDGKKIRIAVRLEAKSTGTHPNIFQPPPGPNCNNTILDNSKHCRDQYCAHHPDDTAHGCDAE